MNVWQVNGKETKVNVLKMLFVLTSLELMDANVIQDF